MSRFYDDALRPTGLRITQFTLLRVIHAAPGLSQKRLGQVLDIDSTTLSRTLAPLERDGLVSIAEGSEDRREVRLTLTPAGERKLTAALPRWERAQRELARVLGKGAWEQMQQSLLKVTAAGRKLR